MARVSPSVSERPTTRENRCPQLREQGKLPSALGFIDTLNRHRISLPDAPPRDLAAAASSLPVHRPVPIGILIRQVVILWSSPLVSGLRISQSDVSWPVPLALVDVPPVSTAWRIHCRPSRNLPPRYLVIGGILAGHVAVRLLDVG
jgi:hypothetical protein